MTKKEAIYWQNFIEKIIDEKVPYIKRSDVDSRRISDFAQRFMTTITGQQYLPQGLFREFLELFANIPEVQEEITKAQEQISAWLENLPKECSEAEIYAMWDEEAPTPVIPLRLDSNGYIEVSDTVERDEEGYLVFPDAAFDEDGFIIVLNQLND